MMHLLIIKLKKKINPLNYTSWLLYVIQKMLQFDMLI